jgi:hypothetical protein
MESEPSRRDGLLSVHTARGEAGFKLPDCRQSSRSGERYLRACDLPLNRRVPLETSSPREIALVDGSNVASTMVKPFPSGYTPCTGFVVRSYCSH